MGYNYKLIVLNKKSVRYIDDEILADSFREAVFLFLKQREELIDSVLVVYCKRPKTEGLKYMGTYDGFSSISNGYSSVSHILYTSDGREYTYTKDGFVTFFDRL